MKRGTHRFQHHIRLRLALNLEFQEDGRAESETVWVTDQVLQLSDLLAACITALLAWLTYTCLVPQVQVTCRRRARKWPAAPGGRARLAAWGQGWAADLALIGASLRAARWADVAGDLRAIGEALMGLKTAHASY
jgi:hypothetical protein